jgi:hypothetical protein
MKQGDSLKVVLIAPYLPGVGRDGARAVVAVGYQDQDLLPAVVHVVDDHHAVVLHGIRNPTLTKSLKVSNEDQLF